MLAMGAGNDGSAMASSILSASSSMDANPFTIVAPGAIIVCGLLLMLIDGPLGVFRNPVARWNISRSFTPPLVSADLAVRSITRGNAIAVIRFASMEEDAHNCEHTAPNSVLVLTPARSQICSGMMVNC